MEPMITPVVIGVVGPSFKSAVVEKGCRSVCSHREEDGVMEIVTQKEKIKVLVVGLT